MGCIQSYFKKAQSGLSPSSTLEPENVEIITEENVSGRASEKISCSVVTEDEPTEDDDPTDRSQGVEATAVRTLAASTGTVAILGTTAQPNASFIKTESSVTTINTLSNLEIEKEQSSNHIVPLRKSELVQEIINLSDDKEESTKILKDGLEEKTPTSTREPIEPAAQSQAVELGDEALEETPVAAAPEDESLKVEETKAEDAPKSVPSEVTIVEETDESKSEAQDESSANEFVNLLGEDQAEAEVSEETKSESSPLVVQAIDLGVKSSSPSTAESDVTMQKEVSELHKTEKDLSDNSISIEEISDVVKPNAVVSNDYNLIENEDTSESVETHSLSTKLHLEESTLKLENIKVDVTEAVNQRLSMLMKEVSDDELPSSVLELNEAAEAALEKPASLSLSVDSPKSIVSNEFSEIIPDKNIVNGVDVWREDSVDKLSRKSSEIEEDVNNLKDNNEYVERVKLKAEDLINEICERAETVNQNGFEPKEESLVVLNSVHLSKASSMDTPYSQKIMLSETKMRPGVINSFEDALMNVNFGEVTSDADPIYNVDESYNLKSGVPDLTPTKSIDKTDESPLDRSDLSFIENSPEFSPVDVFSRKDLTNSQLETVENEIADICERAVEKATQLFNEKCTNDQEDESNEISENGTSTNNPSISFSEDTQILEPKVTIISDDTALATAATTIQATFRGYQVRKANKSKQDLPTTESTMVEDDDLPPPDMDLLGSEGDTISEEDLPQPPEFDDLPLPEDLAELDDYVVTPEIRDRIQRRNTIIEQAKLSASLNESSSDIDSSLSSAATKIQAGIRGYLTRKHLRNATSSTTAPSMDDSDQSLSDFSKDQIKKAISIEDTEIQRHPLLPDDKYMAGKRMSLDSRMKATDGSRVRPPMRSVMSECIDDSVDRQGWRAGSEEEEKAASCIQNSYRNFKTRQRLKRGDAVQMPTTSSSVTPVSTASEEVKEIPKHTGEYHDILALSPPHLQKVVEEEPGSDSNTDEPLDRGTPELTESDAAVKIQSVYRGYKTRKDLNDTNVDIKIDDGVVEKEVGGTDAKVVQESTSSIVAGPEQESASAVAVEDDLVLEAGTESDVAETSDVDEANATKIQAAVRGYLTRKQLEEKKEAAVKIQDNFRRYSARKNAKNSKNKK